MIDIHKSFKINLLIISLFFFITITKILFAETLTLQCSDIYSFKIENYNKNKGYKAFIKYSRNGNYSEVSQFMKIGDTLQIANKERWMPSKCNTRILSLYIIDRNTGILTKKILSLEPENGEPNEKFLNDTKKKYQDLGKDYINKYTKLWCKPKLGKTKVRSYISLGYSQSQIENILQSDRKKWESIEQEMKKTNCKKIEKKF